MHPAYFETRFLTLAAAEDWPKEFAILSAYSTTGEVWSANQNEQADQKLEAALSSENASVRRIVGYSPTTGHCEPSWAVEILFDAACDHGLRFKQDAIYYVTGDDLWVSHCDERRQLIRVGNFRERVRQTIKGPVTQSVL
jgi:hypothetical protein